MLTHSISISTSILLSCFLGVVFSPPSQLELLRRAGTSLSKLDGVLLDDAIEFQSPVRALQYYIFTKPGIVFPINKLCQSLHPQHMLIFLH